MVAPVDPCPLAVPQEVLDELIARLRSTRWTDAIPGSGWDHGADGDTLRRLVDHWAAGFDWRRHEAALNETLPGHCVELDGRRLHFARLPGRGPDPLPLLLLHGWPATYAEMELLAPRLADPLAHGADPADAFDVVVPSLPGHGLSEPADAEGFGADECADVLHHLMTGVLGYPRYGAQGGDRGAFVAAGLGHRHQASVVGIHLNFPTGFLDPEATPTDDEAAWLAETARWSAEEGGYIAVQSTRPQTLAVALNDSPAGLLAWTVDKWRAWSDCDGDVVGYFGADRLLTNATLYWVTGTIRSSMHWYLEHRRRPPVAMRPDRINVPTGVAAFPRETFRVPRSAVARKYALTRWTQMPSGGHFAAMERPDELAEEVRAFFRPLRRL